MIVETPRKQWTYRQFLNGPRSNGAIYDDTGKAVASLVNITNGPIIVRAHNAFPRLLEVCEKTLYRLHVLANGGTIPGQDTEDVLCELCSDLETAIAKATGTESEV